MHEHHNAVVMFYHANGPSHFKGYDSHQWIQYHPTAAIVAPVMKLTVALLRIFRPYPIRRISLPVRGRVEASVKTRLSSVENNVSCSVAPSRLSSWMVSVSSGLETGED